jgi:hypothetical protein
MRGRTAALLGTLVGAAVFLVAAAGCEAIVSDNVGTVVHCVDAPGACPAGQACTDGVCKPSCTGAGCMAQDAGHEAAPDVAIDHPHEDVVTQDTTVHDVVTDPGQKDVAPEAPGLLALGAPCSDNRACESGICGTSTLLTSNVQTPGMESVCTKACCTSTECNDPTVPGFVCFPSVGGNYCVNPTWIGLPAVDGMGTAGSTCGGAADCRSSVCAASVCQDTCCQDSDCGGGTVCQSSVLDDMTSFNCGPSGGAVQQGGDCGDGDGNCKSNLCVDVDIFEGVCVGACCNDTGCAGSSGSTSCSWLEIDNEADGGVEVVRGCWSALNPGKGKFGASCTSAGDCESNLCYNKTSCTAPCCVDTDCAAGTCSYGSFTISSLTLDLQVCVPPS